MTDLRRLADLVCNNAGIEFGPNKINRLVTQFVRTMPTPSGWTFFLYLANAVQMSEAQKRTALMNAEVARTISYSDPTGEAAVNNATKAARRG